MTEHTRAKTKNAALKLCVTAMFSALLSGGKTALAAIPNVEVVTLFVALCAFVWGIGVAVPAVCVFIAVDIAIWGVNTWVISYVVHWNVVALCFWLLSKFPIRKKPLIVVCAASLAVVLTVCFGVLTSAVDTLVGFTGQGFFVDFESFGKRFAAMYVAGVTFFATQTVANLVLFATAFLPLVQVNRKAKLRLFGEGAAEPVQDDAPQQRENAVEQEPCNSNLRVSARADEDVDERANANEGAEEPTRESTSRNARQQCEETPQKRTE